MTGVQTCALPISRLVEVKTGFRPSLQSAIIIIPPTDTPYCLGLGILGLWETIAGLLQVWVCLVRPSLSFHLPVSLSGTKTNKLFLRLPAETPLVVAPSSFLLEG